MDKISELEKIIYNGNDELSLVIILFNFFGAIIISFLVKAFYTRFSFSLTGKMHLGPIIPILTSVIFLVIIIVKSSLALSLGLVGALSIVRFRTPIKEPEELVYLFLAIAVGLGFGAGYPLITSVITLSTLIIIYFFLSNKNISSNEYNLIVDWSDEKISYEVIVETIKKSSVSLKLIRFENSQNHKNSVFLIELDEKINLDALIKQLKAIDNSINISFFESKINW
jgi:hypothetical protein